MRRVVDFLASAQQLRDFATKVGAQYAIPQVRDLVIKKRNDEFGQPVYLWIEPKPTIREYYPERDRVEGLSNLGGLSKRYEVQISRIYTRDQIEQETETYWIDGVVDQFGDLIGGKEVHLLELDDTSSLHWTLTLTEKIAQKGFYS